MCLRTHIVHHIRVWSQHRVHTASRPHACARFVPLLGLFLLVKSIGCVRLPTLVVRKNLVEPGQTRERTHGALRRGSTWLTVYDSRRRWRELEYE